MAGTPDEDPRPARLTGICLSLPQAVRALTGPRADARMGRRPFAYRLAAPRRLTAPV